MSASERRKGKQGELEVVHLLHAHGWTDAKRTSDGRTQDTRGDIADGPDRVHFEVRRRENVNIWACLAQAERDAKPGDLPVVAFRRSRSVWYAALPLDALLSLLSTQEEDETIYKLMYREASEDRANLLLDRLPESVQVKLLPEPQPGEILVFTGIDFPRDAGGNPVPEIDLHKRLGLREGVKIAIFPNPDADADVREGPTP